MKIFSNIYVKRIVSRRFPFGYQSDVYTCEGRVRATCIPGDPWRPLFSQGGGYFLSFLISFRCPLFSPLLQPGTSISISPTAPTYYITAPCRYCVRGGGEWGDKMLVALPYLPFPPVGACLTDATHASHTLTYETTDIKLPSLLCDSQTDSCDVCSPSVLHVILREGQENYPRLLLCVLVSHNVPSSPIYNRGGGHKEVWIYSRGIAKEAGTL